MKDRKCIFVGSSAAVYRESTKILCSVQKLLCRSPWLLPSSNSPMEVHLVVIVVHDAYIIKNQFFGHYKSCSKSKAQLGEIAMYMVPSVMRALIAPVIPFWQGYRTCQFMSPLFCKFQSNSSERGWQNCSIMFRKLSNALTFFIRI